MPDVLIVQDNPFLLSIWAHAVKAEGLSVEAVDNEEKAKKAMIKDPARVVLIDSLLSNVSGFEFCEVVESQPEASRPLVVLLAPNFKLSCQLSRAQRVGATHCWLKYEVDPQDMARLLKAELDGAETDGATPKKHGSWLPQFAAAGLLTHPQHSEIHRAVDQGMEEVRALLASGYFPSAKHRFLWELYYRTDSIDLDSVTPDPSVARLLPEHLAVGLRVLPVSLDGEELVVATPDPDDLHDMDTVSATVGRDIHPCYVDSKQVEMGIALMYSGRQISDQADAVLTSRLNQEASFLGERSLEEVVHDQPVAEFIDSLMLRAIYERASDIHMESREDTLQIRLRVDGLLRDYQELPAEMGPPLIARVKILASLKLAERRLPQDGRISMKLQNRALDFRVSTLPCMSGEKAVLRLLNPDSGPERVQDLGMDSRQCDLMMKLIEQPNGMLLVTGPTGSGKTTTLYAALRHLNKPEVNIVSIEDPVEYRIERANQVQVRSSIGLDFATVLRSVLRQDPDIVMVGEIRDTETAELAAQAALTGHLVLGTLHTNDAPSTIVRLLDMKLPPFILASTLNGVLAQRLVRRLCSECRRPLDEPDPRFPDITSWVADGCSHCHNTGYKGRLGVYELMEVNESMRRAIVEQDGLSKLRDFARADGMISLRDSALARAKVGETSIAEVMRVTIDNQSPAMTAAPA